MALMCRCENSIDLTKSMNELHVKCNSDNARWASKRSGGNESLFWHEYVHGGGVI
jgi:hypothetical protein